LIIVFSGTVLIINTSVVVTNNIDIKPILLNKNIILSLIPEAFTKDIYIKNFDLIDSTNLRLKKKITSKTFLESNNLCSDFILYTAEHQTNGKGRGINKHWESPYGENLYISFAWKLTSKYLKSISTLSIKISQVIIELLTEYHIKNIQFKWPNDIFVNGKKIAGILIEIIKITNDDYAVICGIGLNVNMDYKATLNNTSMKNEITSFKLNDCSSQVYLDRNKVLAKLLIKLMDICSHHNYSIDFTMLKEYNILNYNKAINKPIKLVINNKEFEAQYLEIRNNGSLKVLIDDKVKDIYSVDKLIL
tara:strand:- start:15849 stop:16763 length:915 start_codon:yes stop_codon:yes gene_type:complete